jgi:ligand-binding sensor domain-containing protein
VTEGQLRRLSSADGLLNNTANIVKVSPQGEVWVGSISGASVLRAGRWQTYGAEAGVPGSVINFAFARTGEVWLMWQARPGYSPPANWGVSQLTTEGVQRHVELGALTGLEAPRTSDALAVDGEGRLWFVTQSILKREKFLGVADREGRVEIYSLGQFATSGLYQYGGNGLWQNSFGVMPDGAGGILLYNGDSHSWRRWRP